ncbi:MAG: spore maturation protein [Clostridiales bacterium]|nr:spore maturation protein [Clostridiales bacterium]
MSDFFSALSAVFIPLIFTAVLLYGLFRKAPVYDFFAEGVKEGLQSAVEVLPFIIAIFVGIRVFTASGAMELFQRLLGPIFGLLGVPEELLSLILLRPVSGSGSLVLAGEILQEFGPDSFLGRAASVMTGTCETVFYVLAVYFGVTAVKKSRHALWAGLAGYAAGIAASLWLC